MHCETVENDLDASTADSRCLSPGALEQRLEERLAAMERLAQVVVQHVHEQQVVLDTNCRDLTVSTHTCDQVNNNNIP